MRILCALQRGPKTVTEIALRAEISVPNASQHLRFMRDRGAVIAQKHAQNVYYDVADPRITGAMMLIHESLAERLHQNAVRASGRPTGSARRKISQPA
jgi:DNA-binding transcriptional ArsR family regulator